MLAADGLLDHTQRLCQGMAGERGGGRGPEEVHQVVACEAFARLEREPDQEGEVLAGAQPDVLPRRRDQEGSAEREQSQRRQQTRLLTTLWKGSIRRRDQRRVNTWPGTELGPTARHLFVVCRGPDVGTALAHAGTQRPSCSSSATM